MLREAIIPCRFFTANSLYCTRVRGQRAAIIRLSPNISRHDGDLESLSRNLNDEVGERETSCAKSSAFCRVFCGVLCGIGALFQCTRALHACYSAGWVYGSRDYTRG